MAEGDCDDQLVMMLLSNLCLFPGATGDTVLDGVKAEPDLFPKNSKGVPDINFYYRYRLKVRLHICLLWVNPNCELVLFQVKAGDSIM